MTVRELYAEEIEASCGIRNAALTRAFAEVPRERFLGPGPWTVSRDAHDEGPALLAARTGFLPLARVNPDPRSPIPR